MYANSMYLFYIYARCVTFLSKNQSKTTSLRPSMPAVLKGLRARREEDKVGRIRREVGVAGILWLVGVLGYWVNIIRNSLLRAHAHALNAYNRSVWWWCQSVSRCTSSGNGLRTTFKRALLLCISVARA